MKNDNKGQESGTRNEGVGCRVQSFGEGRISLTREPPSQVDRIPCHHHSEDSSSIPARRCIPSAKLTRNEIDGQVKHVGTFISFGARAVSCVALVGVDGQWLGRLGLTCYPPSTVMVVPDRS